MISKAELRKIFKAKRQTLSLDELKELSKQIAEQIIGLQLTGKGSVFLSIDRFKEIDTSFIIKSLGECEMFAPKMKGLELEHFPLNESTIVETNFWGIPEPQNGEKIDPSWLDFVIVPLLAYDKKGGRVGYGKGIYDRFLAKCSPECKFVGVSFYEPIDTLIETTDSDINLNCVVTPQEIIDFE